LKVPFFAARRVEDVFGMSAAPRKATYVDRGGLDRRLKAALPAGMHVVIHGESKHGKSWLRAHGLPDEEIARVQCLPGMSAEEAIEGALGAIGVNAPVKLTQTATESSKDQVKGHFGGKRAGVELGLEDSSTDEHSLEQVPVGQAPRDIGWVAGQFGERGRRPVFEDFHNLSVGEQQKMAFAIKALGEYGLPCVVVGIWPNSHLLAYHNGELEGRIEDLHVTWSGDELQRVLQQGERALRVEIDPGIKKQLVADCYTSVGLLQELTRELLVEAGIEHRKVLRQRVADTEGYRRARARVVERVGGRFGPFITEFPKGPTERPGGHEELLRFIVERADDNELLEGVRVERVHSEVSIGLSDVAVDDVVAMLHGLGAHQIACQVSPAVLTFDYPRQLLVLADRRFLLYRRYARPRYPWER
jgi:cell division inhibitor SulA